MSDVTLAQEISVLLAAPIVTLAGTGALIFIIWRIVNWAYKLQIDGLKEQIKAITDQRDLANQQLAYSKEQLENFRNLETQKSLQNSNRFVPVNEIYPLIDKLIASNTATLSVSGAPSYIYSYMKDKTTKLFTANIKNSK